MSKKANFFTFLLLLTSFCLQAQIDKFDRKTELLEVQSGWNKLVMPLDMYNHVQSDFSDVRIFGILASGDTVEAPFVVQTDRPVNETEKLRLEVFDQSKKNGLYYSTIRVPEKLTELELEVAERNFDWHLKVEGSYDQKSWFTLVDDARIVGISNSSTNYLFTKISIPPSKYTFYRLHEIKGAKAEILSAYMLNQNQQFVNWIELPCTTTIVKPKEKSKETILQLNFGKKVPLSELSIQINDLIDFIRPIEFQYLSQKIKTEAGEKAHYVPFHNGTISSYEKGIFSFEPNWTDEVRIIIQNDNNQPLNIGRVTGRGYRQNLVFRTTEPGNYFLVYGGNRVSKPVYDIEQFATKNIDYQEVSTSTIEDIEQPKADNKSMDMDSIWLWIVMMVAIVLIGWFTIGMIRKK